MSNLFLEMLNLWMIGLAILTAGARHSESYSRYSNGTISPFSKWFSVREGALSER